MVRKLDLHNYTFISIRGCVREGTTPSHKHPLYVKHNEERGECEIHAIDRHYLVDSDVAELSL